MANLLETSNYVTDIYQRLHEAEVSLETLYRESPTLSHFFVLLKGSLRTGSLYTGSQSGDPQNAPNYGGLA